MTTLLTAKGIKKSFYNDSLETAVLKGVDLELQEGEFVSIMGKSGSGKSTLLNILSTLDKADSGEIKLQGQDISQLEDEKAGALRRETFGFVFQLPRMVKNLSILDNILLPSMKYKVNKAEAKEEALTLMDKIGILEIADKRLSQVSGGQLQRAGICRAIINQPKLIFADEPTGALDSKSGKDVLDLFATLHREGKTILLVTHDINVAAMSERVLFMKDGLLYKNLQLGNDPAANALEVQEQINHL
ncbi:ABC transporter ATP-binding protein [Streptococcus ferus]|uniref:ABC transporter ATP-binding protein n=1 Tax=Streptococcus ferus TaxID=1345 RepID=UPI0035A14ADC